jgi:hypothetical protein
MKLKLKEDPKEWRKAALFSTLGLAILSSLLRWRRVLPAKGWIIVLIVLACVALSALAQPRWFRGWYRFSSRLGFYISRFIGCALLAILFFLILTPLGLLLRLLGKDLLRLKRARDTTTYWNQARESGPLDRLF